ncbi:udp-3-o-(3-hydroxymyristoyl) glucosamine n-acyltransferase : UDP-3-O-acylglucosamine N-acyltransferase OS=Singulisphaera acidiphila (strain ATCC BAA-1392 / DSM 18658 / VKM B-2454 / MOB10) GN=lpxD PE=3 SV=1: LpxD: Hexapep: Hexapep: Hexapep: Hexapep [Gemmataceae bacterium]|jgi:UDP-3-O-[3-hydroxymyristoyl] glucosamine N-acyltransferase|nr:udp-3-o-(3-hydroxymyristoyl) glucosamine n-acyltransferase : UDP-3-O-acylglucosamine N-acyltransferase OS=Singulisphaera acidiphila (strain ATCC BAA-1392 / DSM 18658 / VKM B-2454 / MOB10) GN=lpxD PE=3 SV=1: LpxD: Hexapep: Hexapep: Hexapep: Hexapep [Gemmataceae bacterium]VTT98466.1 udp-3-o-(3-hydroxymyristoyl) glucosamine n-acyltransferase : UDP-3-O-acylglucosamine N-acyltransferase OS=Singulisphaera acidiphila (strain ATCC BAA-1392 / DSM 18658 / VKM B-2454 / MOB10) GN=lpxD PE=3 SV=1: LpxD: Hexa
MGVQRHARKKGPTVTITVRHLAEWVRGEVLGDGDLPISSARTLAEAQPGDITFVEHDKHLNAWHNSRASAALVPLSVPVNGRPIIRVADPLMAFAQIVQQLRGWPPESAPSIHPTAHVHPTAQLAPGVSVGPFAVVGENCEIGANTTLHAGAVLGRFCKVGEGCVLHPHAVVYDGCTLGHRVVLHSNSVIGADGFGYRFQNGRHVKVPQLGSVEVEDDVEIGACTTIDRGTFGATRVGAGTKIDNLVMVGHNCNIGKHNILCSQVGIAGSTTTGDYVVMAGQVGVADHVTIGDRVTIMAKSGVSGNIASGSQVLGTPALPHREQARIMSSCEKLPEMRKDLNRVKKHLGLEDS